MKSCFQPTAQQKTLYKDNYRNAKTQRIFWVVPRPLRGPQNE